MHQISNPKQGFVTAVGAGGLVSGPADSGRQCWCFGSTGLQALGQKELVFLLECLPDEKVLPKDLFSLYLNIYQEAQKGRRPAVRQTG